MLKLSPKLYPLCLLHVPPIKDRVTQSLLLVFSATQAVYMVCVKYERTARSRQWNFAATTGDIVKNTVRISVQGFQVMYQAIQYSPSQPDWHSKTDLFHCIDCVEILQGQFLGQSYPGQRHGKSCITSRALVDNVVKFNVHVVAGQCGSAVDATVNRMAEASSPAGHRGKCRGTTATTFIVFAL